MSSSVTDMVRQEAQALSAKHAHKRKAVQETVSSILDQAEAVAENAMLYGCAAREVFAKCEESLKRLMHQDAAQTAQGAALSAISDKLATDAEPADVAKAMLQAVKEATEKDEAKLAAAYEPLKKLRRMMADADAREGGGAGPSGSAADDELGDEGFAISQAARSSKCPLLQVEMTSSGELRPIKSPACGHTWSHKGIMGFLKNKRGPVPCPTAGCQQTVTVAALVDDKALAKELKKAEQKDDA